MLINKYEGRTVSVKGSDNSFMIRLETSGYSVLYTQRESNVMRSNKSYHKERKLGVAKWKLYSYMQI